jgi:hypothetical protein
MMRLSDYEKDKAALRLMIAERGINGLLETIGDVCDDIAETKHNRDNNYGAIWMERGEELRKLGKEYNIGRRADRR